MFFYRSFSSILPPGPQLSAPKGIVNVYFPTNSSVFIINVGLSHFVVGFLKRQQTQQSSNKSVVGTALVFAPHSSTHSHTQCEWHTKFKPILIFDCEKKNILSRSPSNAICFIFPFGGCFFPICVRVFSHQSKWNFFCTFPFIEIRFRSHWLLLWFSGFSSLYHSQRNVV